MPSGTLASPAAEAPAAPAASAILKDPNALRLCSGQLISQVCDKMMTVGLVWVLSERCPASAIAWFLAVSALPHVLLAWNAGRWTSALGPLRTVIVADWARAALFAILALAWPRIPVASQVPALFAASFAANCAAALFNPAILALPVWLAGPERLQSMTALIDSCFGAANVIGPAASALLYPWLGLRGLLLCNGLSYALAAWLEAGVRLRSDAPAAQARRARGIPEVLAGDRLVRFMLAGFLAMNLFLAPLLVFLPLFARASFGGTIRTLAWLESSLSAGTLAASGALAFCAVRAGLGARITAGMCLTSALYLAFALTRSSWQGCLCLAGLGVCLSASNVFILNLFQTRTRAEDVPVVMSLANLISTACLPLSMSLVGLAVGRFSPRDLALACSGALALVTAFVASDRELRAA